jgi:hypothetical protein
LCCCYQAAAAAALMMTPEKMKVVELRAALEARGLDTKERPAM